MAFPEITAAPRSAGMGVPRPVELVCFGLLVSNLAYLCASYFDGLWILTSHGGGIPTDFVNVWAAGRLVLEGHPAAVYDWPTHKAAEEMALGGPFAGYFGWHYPPVFLFAAAALALVPYGAAFGLWLAMTFPVYVVAIRAIVGSRIGYLFAAAFPAVLCNSLVGQNGFLSAGLMGGALLMLTKRPVLAGIAFGALTYKPHLGILIPVALIAAGQWRTIAAAGVTTAVMPAISWLAFGTETWRGFIGNIGHTSTAFLSNGFADFGKLQTAFGLVRTLGGSEPLAWIVQSLVIAAAAVMVAALWRSRARYEIKAAGLAAASMLATPYLYTYDLVVLAVPLAFLLRVARESGFEAHELTMSGVACALIVMFPFVTAPVGFFAVLVVAWLVARRALHATASAASAPIL